MQHAYISVQYNRIHLQIILQPKTLALEATSLCGNSAFTGMMQWRNSSSRQDSTALTLASGHVQMLAVTVTEIWCGDSNCSVNMQYITMPIQTNGPFGMRLAYKL